jgi:hypothetical protein
MPPPRQQLDAEFVFPRGDALADGRADNAFFLAGTGNIASFTHRDEQTQGRQIKITHGFLPSNGKASMPASDIPYWNF